MPKKILIINFVLFQLGWFACVLGAAYGVPWWAFLCAVVIVGGQLVYAQQIKPALALIVISVIVGGMLDQILLNHQLLQYQSHGWSSRVVPVWILGLWMLFASTLNVSLRWLREYPMVAALFGAIGGPLAYLGAAKLGAVFILQTPLSYGVLSVAWALMMLFLITLSKKFDGYAHV